MEEKQKREVEVGSLPTGFSSEDPVYVAARRLLDVVNGADDISSEVDALARAMEYADRLDQYIAEAPQQQPQAPDAADITDALCAAAGLLELIRGLRAGDTASRGADASQLLAAIADGLGLPRGGVEVTAEDARRLRAMVPHSATHAPVLLDIADRLERGLGGGR